LQATHFSLLAEKFKGDELTILSKLCGYFHVRHLNVKWLDTLAELPAERYKNRIKT